MNSSGNPATDESAIAINWHDKQGAVIHEWRSGQVVPTQGLRVQLGGGRDEVYAQNADSLQFDLLLGDELLSAGIDIPVDLDLPGFGLDIGGGIGVILKWYYQFGFGISVSDGFYLATTDVPDDPGTSMRDESKELEVRIDAALDGNPNTREREAFTASGRFLFFDVAASDGSTPSTLIGLLGIDVQGGDDERLSLDDVLSNDLSEAFDVKLAANANVGLSLTLQAADGLELNIGTAEAPRTVTASMLPKLKAEMAFAWHWELGQALVLPTIALNDFRIELGSVVADFLLPVAAQIRDTLKPIEPIIKALTFEIVPPPEPNNRLMQTVYNTLDSNGDHRVDLMDLMDLATGSPNNWDFVFAAENMLELVESVLAIQTEVDTPGEVYISLGNISISGASGKATATSPQGGTPSQLNTPLARLEERGRGKRGNHEVNTNAPPRDGFQIHIFDMSNWAGLLNLVNLEARLDADIGVYADLAGTAKEDHGHTWYMNLFRFNLFNWRRPAPQADLLNLGTQTGGTLTLHAGRRAPERNPLYSGGVTAGMTFETKDDVETYVLSGNSGALNVSFGDPAKGGWSKTYSGVSRVVGYGGLQNDTIDASATTGVAVEFYGEEGNDTLITGTGGGILDGGAGNDTLDASRAVGAVEIHGGPGNDTITGGKGNDTITAGEGDDRISSGAGNDTVRGDQGADNIDAGEGNDTIAGGGGNDRLNGGPGADYYAFGNGWGNDTLSDPGGGSTMDFSSVTVTLVTHLSAGGGADFKSDSNHVSGSRADVRKIMTRLDVFDLREVGGLQTGSRGGVNDKIAAQLSALAQQTTSLRSALFIRAPEILGQKIPGTNTTLDELFSVSSYLDLGVFIEHYLHPILNPDQAMPQSDPIPAGTDSQVSVEGFLDYLQAHWFPRLLGGQASGERLDLSLTKEGRAITGFGLTFTGDSAYNKEIPIGISEPVNGIGPAFVELEAGFNAQFAFSFNVNWQAGAETAQWALDRLEFDATANNEQLVIPVRIGDLEASAGHPRQNKGSIHLDMHVNIESSPGAYTVRYDPAGEPISGLDMRLPLYAWLAGQDVNRGLEASLTLDRGDFFLSPRGRGSRPLNWVPANLDNLADFTNLRVADFRDRLLALRDNWLEEFTANSRFNIGVPFVDTDLARILDFGPAFDAAVLAKMNFEGVDSLQDMIAEFIRNGLVAEGQRITYDPATQQINVPLAFSVDLDRFSLDDLDALGRVNLDLLIQEGLVELGDAVDPDRVLDEGFVALARLAELGLLKLEHVIDWEKIDQKALTAAGIIGRNSLDKEFGFVDMVDLDALLNKGLATLSDVVEAGFVTLESIAANLLPIVQSVNVLASSLADFGLDLSAFVSNGLIDLNNLVRNSPIQLRHLVYFGLVKREHLPSLGTVSKADQLSSGIIDRSQLERQEIPVIIAKGYLALRDLTELGLLKRDNLADLRPADADLFGFDVLTLAELDRRGLIIQGDNVSLEKLFAHTDVTFQRLVEAGLLSLDDLRDNLSAVLLDDLFVQGKVNRSALLASNLIETRLLTPLVMRADKVDVVPIAALLDNNLATLADLVEAGLLSRGSFDLSGRLTENAILKSALVSAQKLDDNGLLQQGTPDDFVVIDHLLQLRLVSLFELVQEGLVRRTSLTATNLELAAVLASDVVARNALERAGIEGDGDIDLEALVDSGLVTLSALEEQKLADSAVYFDSSVVSLRQLAAAGLIDANALKPNLRVTLASVLASDALGQHYLSNRPALFQDLNANHKLDTTDRIRIETLLADPNLSLERLLAAGVLTVKDFIDKVFDQATLEGKALFANVDLDKIVRVGTVPLGPATNVSSLLGSPLFRDITLNRYAEAGFIDVFDFNNTDLEVTQVETLFSQISNDVIVTRTVNGQQVRVVSLYNLVGLGTQGVALEAMLAKGLVTAADLIEPEMGLDIRDLENSDQFEAGDLNNFISRHDVHLRDVAQSVSLNGLLGEGLISANDLILRHLGDLAEFVEAGLLGRDSFAMTEIVEVAPNQQTLKDKTLTEADLVATGAVSSADLAARRLVSEGKVRLVALLDSGLVSLKTLVDKGLLDSDDLAPDMTSRTIQRIFDSNVIEAALLERNNLILASRKTLSAEHAGAHAVIELDDVTGIVPDAWLDIRDGAVYLTGFLVESVDKAAKTITIDLASNLSAGAAVEVTVTAEADKDGQVFLNGANSILGKNLAPLTLLILRNVINPSPLNNTATLDKDELVKNAVVAISQTTNTETAGKNVVVELSDVTGITAGATASILDGVHNETGLVIQAVDTSAKTITVNLASPKQSGAKVEVRGEAPLVTLEALAAANLITAADLAVTELDLKELGQASALDLETLDNLQIFINLGLVTRAELDGHAAIEKNALIASGLVTEQQLIDAGLLGKYVTLPSVLRTNSVTIEELKATGLDNRDGRVSVPGLVRSNLMTVAELEAAGLIATKVDLEELLESGLVTLLQLVDDSVDKAALTSAVLTGGKRISEQALINAGLFDPNVDIAALLRSNLVTAQNLVAGGLVPATVDIDDLLALNLITPDQFVVAGLATQAQMNAANRPSISFTALLSARADSRDPASTLITADDLAAHGFFAADINRQALIEKELVTDALLNEAHLTGSSIRPIALLASGLVSPEQLAQAGFIGRTVNKNALTSGTFAAAAGVTVTETQLAHAGLVRQRIDTDDLVAAGLTTRAELIAFRLRPSGDTAPIQREDLDDLPRVDYDTLNLDPVRLAFRLASDRIFGAALLARNGLVDLDDILDNRFPTRNGMPIADLAHLVANDLVTKADLKADAKVSAARLTAAGLFTMTDLTGRLDADGQVLVSTLLTGDAAAQKALLLRLAQKEIITRFHLNNLGSVRLMALNLAPEALGQGLVDANDHVDLDDILDVVFPDQGQGSGQHRDGPLMILAQLVELGLVDEKDLNGHDLDYFGLNNLHITLAGDYGLDLTGLESDAIADIRAIVSGHFRLIVDLDGETGTATENQTTWYIEDATLSGKVSFVATDLDVKARLGFIGVTLADVSGLESRVRVDLERTVTYDGDNNLATTNDRRFLLDQLLNGQLQDKETYGVSGQADAVLRGIKINSGIGGIPVAHGAAILFQVPDLARPKTQSNYLTHTLQNLPGIFLIHRYLKLDDVLAAMLRVRDYLRQAFDKLPFWVTDPKSPIYEIAKDIKIPVINISPLELVQFILQVDDGIDAVQRLIMNPRNDVQKLISIVMDYLGIEIDTDSETFKVWMQGNVLRVRLSLKTPDIDKNFPFEFDLEAFKELASGIDLSALDGIKNLVQFEGSGTVNLKLYASAQLDAGIDLRPRKDGQPVDKFLFDWNETLKEGTRVDARFKVLGQELNFKFKILDSIGVQTLNNARFDLDNDGVLDATLYDTAITIDSDANTTTNPELTDFSESDKHADFVKVIFELKQGQATGVPNDGLFHFNEWQFGETVYPGENLIGDNVQFAGVNGGFELIMPWQLDISGTVIGLTGDRIVYGSQDLDQKPLRIRTNPVYMAVPVGDKTVNQGLTGIFLHLADSKRGGADPVLFDMPNLGDTLGDLADSKIRGLIEDLAALIGDLKQDLLETGFFDTPVPGTGKTIAQIMNDLGNLENNNYLPGVPMKRGIEAYLDIDTYIHEYLKTVPWVGGTNEIQRVQISGTPTAGTFRIQFTNPENRAQIITAPIAFNASRNAIQTAVDNAIGASQVAIEGTAGNFTVSFYGRNYGARRIEPLVVDISRLTGATGAIFLTCRSAPGLWPQAMCPSMTSGRAWLRS